MEDPSPALCSPSTVCPARGSSVSGDMGAAAAAAHRVPGIGGALAAPFSSLGSAGRTVSGSGSAVETAVGTLATVLAVVLVVLPVGWLLVRWLPWRARWARD